METTIENGQVVQTTTVDLESFVQRKQDEIQMLQQQIALTTERLNNVLAELSNLIK